jgi:hypothetical protein
MSRIVIWDPSGRFPEGEILTGENALGVLHSQGGVTLPVKPELFGLNAVAGFFSRNWGNGVPFLHMVGTRACSMLLYVQQGIPSLNWVARLAPIDGAKEVRGTFRLVCSTAQVGIISGGLATEASAIEIADLQPDKWGGYTIGGKCNLNCTLDGYLGLSLYGCAIGCKVLWTAITQA